MFTVVLFNLEPIKTHTVHLFGPWLSLWIVQELVASSGDEPAMRVITDKGMSILIWGVSKNHGTPKSSILIGFSTRFSIINHPFWGYPYFWKHPYISRNLDGSKAKLRNTRSPCRSIHRSYRNGGFPHCFRHVLGVQWFQTSGRCFGYRV